MIINPGRIAMLLSNLFLVSKGYLLGSKKSGSNGNIVLLLHNDKELYKEVLI